MSAPAAPSRRRLLQSAGLAGLFGLMPRLARAIEGGKRRFLFVFCPGGWDPAVVFAPVFGSSHVDLPEDAEPAEANGISYIAGASRPAVTAFFDTWGQEAALINGMEVRSVNHHVCKRLVLTGSPAEVGDDWPALLGGVAQDDPEMPVVHLSGPTFSHRYGSAVVRLGERGQLVRLLTGEALSSTRVSPPSTAVEAALRSHLEATLDERLALAGSAEERRLLGHAEDALRRQSSLAAIADQLGLAVASTFPERLAVLVDLLAEGYARCGTVAFEGYLDIGWDTHATNNIQHHSFDLLFEALGGLCADLAARPGLESERLLDDVTIVVLSEMGRYPKFNGHGGKEHWTFTSALLIGGGVAGGQVVGAYSDSLGGQAVDLASGATVSSGGELLLPAHLGATLLALADIDPGEVLPGVSPIAALLA